MIWIQFVISAVLIVFAGSRLTRDADRLSEMTGLGKVWMGVALLGVVTSLPEAVASLTSVVMLKANDLAVSNLLGSNTFNPVLIVVLDLFVRSGSVTDQVSYTRARVLPAYFASGLVLCVAAGIAWPFAGDITLGPLGVESLLIMGCFFWGMKRVAGSEQRVVVAPASSARNGQPSREWGQLARGLVFNALLVVLAAVWLARVADRIAVQTGWGQTFVGSALLALVTSLPEMVVTVSALKMGALDLAIGNIFGSNMSNVFILAVCDLFYMPGALLRTVSRSQLLPAGCSVVMMMVILAGIRQKKKPRWLGLGWDSYLLLAIFFLNLVLLYLAR